MLLLVKYELRIYAVVVCFFVSAMFYTAEIFAKFAETTSEVVFGMVRMVG